MKFRVGGFIAIYLGAISLLAGDVVKLPLVVQTINSKYDRQAQIAQRAYWQAILSADRAKLKDLQEAMVAAAKQNNVDTIPVIQREIEQTKASIAHDSDANGSPVTQSTPPDFTWLEGTTWRLGRDSNFSIRFNADHTLSGGDRGTWKALDANTIGLTREKLTPSSWTFASDRRQAMDEVFGEKIEAGSVFVRSEK